MNDDERNIVWHHSTLNKQDRQNLHQHKSVMIWLTGLSGSGKSTIANMVQNYLHEKGISVYLLDGDNLRHGINKNLSFSEEDRKENIRRTAEIGKLFVDAGVVVLAALISPFDIDRQLARSIYNSDEFIEVFIDCSLDVCENRDPKGLYKKARAGKIKQFTGIDQAYEKPANPEIIIETDKYSVEESANILLSFLIDEIKIMEVGKDD
ncbi:adenylylsulfate kinase [Cytobacillus horneckiae]|uniref:Adenylyl-sulfate kinase n=1 Tax=Cytobacillus horneckiae TaxID=549687 RepID=A0A2N0ZEY4_9BACI|nr:adenylyl-sulfate kinase [Cytobacillus horneckiae]NRG44853.1 adenylyl-sulfate kinase [Bacillus sp. CRN 9]MBN6889522.1 adenylyl-sulfate kinase [Cytobacillus horneckiae]MCM3176794.1 adenylyl-sulfate kinase [Cytobacillus horneckiae]MEC1156634.1 adenylyl-sulfate kinase [Cytobacillus horneckiae]MED2939144.1 adenylyl-sulfate kinase [Cytobacillus horneckiae]